VPEAKNVIFRARNPERAADLERELADTAPASIVIGELGTIMAR
jgi:hypothetical protein